MLSLSTTMATAGVVSAPDTSGPDSFLTGARPEQTRKQAIRVYFVLSIMQVICGLCALTTSSISVHFHSGGGNFPYYIGSFCIAAMLLTSSCLAFRVYNKGPLFCVSNQSKKEVICALSWHRIVSFLMFFGCVFGLAIIWMYGLCMMAENDCSYEDYEQENKIMAYIAFVIGILALFSSATGLLIVQKYGPAFGIQITSGQRGGLRYVGFRDNIIDELRRQNEQMQRQLDQVNSPNSNMPPGLQGITNYGFEPPTPPPYSPTAVEVSLSSNGDSSVSHTQQQNSIATTSSPIAEDPPKYSEIDIGVLPSEPPPPYKESEDNNDGDGTR